MFYFKNLKIFSNRDGKHSLIISKVDTDNCILNAFFKNYFRENKNRGIVKNCTFLPN